MSWRRVVHEAIVEALTKSPLFQTFAARTSGRVNELGGKSARILQDLQQQQQQQQQGASAARPDALPERASTFLSVFLAELRVGLDKMFWRGR